MTTVERQNSTRVFEQVISNKQSYEEYLKHLGAVMGMLCLAQERINEGLYQTGTYLINLARDMVKDDDCSELIDVIMTVWESLIVEKKQDEFHYQYLFKKYAERIIADCKVIEHESDEHNQPDAWIEVRGEEIPVEVKLESFNKKALRQLRRYMIAFGTSKGVAVGRTLDVELPPNIVFISNDMLDEYDGKNEREEMDRLWLDAFKHALLLKNIQPRQMTVKVWRILKPECI